MCLGQGEDGHKEIPTGTAVARACIDHVSPTTAAELEVKFPIPVPHKDLPVNREHT